MVTKERNTANTSPGLVVPAELSKSATTALTILGVSLAGWLILRDGDSAQAQSGPVRIGASIKGLTIQSNRIAPARAHKVNKRPGENTISSFAISNNTVDKTGSAIPWSFRVTTRLGRSIFPGWQSFGESQTVHTNISAAGSRQGSAIIPAPNEANRDWDIHVELEAKVSNDQGNQTSEWFHLAEFKHDGAIRTINPDLTADPDGTIGTITVTQRRGLMRSRRGRR